MPTLDQHASFTRTKLLLMGASGSGKTGALASLANAGHKLVIADFDEGLDALVAYTKPDCRKNIHYLSFSDSRKLIGAKMVVDMPKAIPNFMSAMNNWEGLGAIAKLDSSYTFVLDSLSFFGSSALNFVLAMSGKASSANIPQQSWGEAQRIVEETLAMITSNEVKCNVIITAHIKFLEDESGAIIKGLPSTLGKALSPKIPAYFNTVVLAQCQGSGESTKRVIRTKSDFRIDLKCPNSHVPTELPLETGLATLFSTLQKGE